MRRVISAVAIVFFLTCIVAVSVSDAAPVRFVFKGTWTGNGDMMDKSGTVTSSIPVVLSVEFNQKGLFKGLLEENPPDSFLSFSVTGTFTNPNLTFSGIDADGVTVFGFGQVVGKTIKLQIYDFKNGTTTVILKRKGS